MKATIKARRKELAEVKLMRDTFEKNERKALNKSSVYREVHKHTKNKGRNAYKGFLPFFEKPGAITTTPLKEKKTTPLVKLHLPFHTFNI